MIRGMTIYNKKIKEKKRKINKNFFLFFNMFKILSSSIFQIINLRAYFKEFSNKIVPFAEIYQYFTIFNQISKCKICPPSV